MSDDVETTPELDRIRAQFQGQVFDEFTVTPSAERLVEYAKACGEQAPQYTDPQHTDFQAVPTWPSSVQARSRFPEGFPTFKGLGMDAGKKVTNQAPIRAGVTLTAKTHIEDLYRKSGRSGHMTFIVLRTNLHDAADAVLASADTSVVIRERKS